ncbi:carbohydrate esterase family 16 protein [Macrolepiota fuliginosa MF-IS2]|uniref:Carbohydrate esterase family 16 protein n=1 Tax=Macrolepiota fuliginosa MF-IS2 TaxID=1400762 RepID=A0A9P5X7J7_9AGAR|nr:carbohydrate esterase family 16 protein [Macrolepiota fuliginosa MF-IS2]
MQRLSVISKLSLALAALVPLAIAQSPIYGQCGGVSWTGSTTCVAGSTCVKQNDYYSQCIPGASTSAPSSSSTSAPTSTSTSAPAPPAGVKYWFSFGDSYTQTGFDPTSTLPSAGNLLGNPPYPGWTATGGENWVDYVTSQYNKSLLLTYNYAYGGATIDANLVQPYESTVLSLTDQVNQFLSGAATKPASTPWTSGNSLFSVWIGINDIGNSYYLSGDRDAFSDTLLNAYFALVQKLYNTGARNFLFVNVPPIDRSPMMIAQGQSAQSAESTVINSFNTKLVAKVNAFKAANSGVQTYIWDSHTQFGTILDSPTTYGFRDATTYGTGSDIFWGNNYHPSSYAHKYFGQQVGNVVLANTVF